MSELAPLEGLEDTEAYIQYYYLEASAHALQLERYRQLAML